MRHAPSRFRAPGGLRATATGLALVMSLSMLYGAEAAVAAPVTAGPAQQGKNTAQSAADVPSARVAARL
nr:hypothetical protein OG296_40065 [Streptomyces sp. NBC_01001]